MPEVGIDFNILVEQIPKVTKSNLGSIQRLHMNTGHPPYSELERIVRTSGGSEILCLVVKVRRCTSCRKSQDPRLPRPSTIKEGIGKLNEAVLADIGYVKDSGSKTWEFLIMIDDGTD